MALKAKSPTQSKGRRKQPGKKPFLSKNEILWLVGIIGVIALAVVFFNVFYHEDTGALPMKDGAPVVENAENSVVTSVGTDDNIEYFKVCEVGQVEGFLRERTPDEYNENKIRFNYFPEDPENKLSYVRIAGGTSDYEKGYNAFYLSVSASYGVTPTLLKETIDGRKVVIIIANYETTDSATGLTYYSQELRAYMPAALADKSIIITENISGETDLTGAELTAFLDDTYMTQAELMDVLYAFIPTISTKTAQ